MWGRLWQKTNNDNFVWKNLGSVTKILFAGTVIWKQKSRAHIPNRIAIFRRRRRPGGVAAAGKSYPWKYMIPSSLDPLSQCQWLR